VVRQASNIAAQSHADITLIKLAVRIIAMRCLSPPFLFLVLPGVRWLDHSLWCGLGLSALPRSLNRGKREQFDKQVMNLMGHEERCPLEWVDSVTRAAKLIMPLLPKDARLSTRDFVGVAATILQNPLPPNQPKQSYLSLSLSHRFAAESTPIHIGCTILSCHSASWGWASSRSPR